MLQSSATSDALVVPKACAPDDPVAIVEGVLATPDHDLDYARAKLAFDRIIDPSIDIDAVLRALEAMVETAKGHAGELPSPDAKLVALRSCFDRERSARGCRN